MRRFRWVSFGAGTACQALRGLPGRRECKRHLSIGLCGFSRLALLSGLSVGASISRS
jgi:hypothetical protein